MNVTIINKNDKCINIKKNEMRLLISTMLEGGLECDYKHRYYALIYQRKHSDASMWFRHFVLTKHPRYYG